MSKNVLFTLFFTLETLAFAKDAFKEGLKLVPPYPLKSGFAPNILTIINLKFYE